MAVPPSIAKLSLEELQKLTVECLKKLKVQSAGCCSGCRGGRLAVVAHPGTASVYFLICTGP